MPKTAIVTARVDAEVKNRVQEVLASADISCSQAIQGLFDYIVYTGETPDFILDSYQYRPQRRTPQGKYAAMLDWIEHGPLAGLDLTSLSDEEVEHTKQEYLEHKYRMSSETATGTHHEGRW